MRITPNSFAILCVIAFFTCIVVIDTSASAQSASASLSLREAVIIALDKNPDLRVTRAMVGVAAGEARIASALPNPSFTGSPNSPYQYGLSIPLDVGPQRIYRQRAGNAGLEAAEYDTRDASRQLTLAVQRAYLDVLLDDGLIELARDRMHVLTQLHAADSARARAGEIPERNLSRSAIELARATADLEHAINDDRLARIALQSLLGDRIDAGVALRDSLEALVRPLPPLDTVLSAALHARPDLVSAGFRQAQRRAERSLARSALVPTPDVSFVRQFDVPFTNGHYYSFGISLELPLFNSFAGQRQRAAAALSAADAEQQRMTAIVRRDVASAYTTVQAQERVLQQFSAPMLETVAQNIDAARYAYERGATSLLDVLDAVRALQDFRALRMSAIHDYRLARFTLDAAAGAT